MEIEFSSGDGGRRQAPRLGALLRDPSLLAILAGNAVALAVALQQDWPLIFLLWPYWLQSLAIGWFARRRILSLTRFTTEGLTIDDQPVAPNVATQRKVANFFALHYGLFHAVYFVFLLAFGAGGELGPGPTRSDLLLFLALGVGFVLAHGSSHRRNLAADARGERNLGALMFLPYLRILPMHLTILCGAILGGQAILLFAGLKFAADATMHVVEHRWLQSARLADDPGVAVQRGARARVYAAPNAKGASRRPSS